MSIIISMLNSFTLPLMHWRLNSDKISNNSRIAKYRTIDSDVVFLDFGDDEQDPGLFCCSATVGIHQSEQRLFFFGHVTCRIMRFYDFRQYPLESASHPSMLRLDAASFYPGAGPPMHLACKGTCIRASFDRVRDDDFLCLP